MGGVFALFITILEISLWFTPARPQRLGSWLGHHSVCSLRLIGRTEGLRSYFSALTSARFLPQDVQSRSKVADCVYSIYKLTAHKHRVDAERILHKPSQNSFVSLPRLPETPDGARMMAR